MKADSSPPTKALNSGGITDATYSAAKDDVFEDGGAVTEDQKTDLAPKSKFSLRVFRYGTFTDYTMITLSIILNMASGALLPFFMSLFGDLVRTINVPGGRDLNWYIRLQMYLGVAAFALCWSGATLMEMAAERQMRAIQTGFVRAITRQEMGWFDQFDAGELSSRLNEACKIIREALGIKLAQVFMFLGIFVGGYVVGFIRGWRMALVVSATLPFLALAGGIMMKLVADSGAKSRKAYSGAGSVAEEALSTIRSIASFGLENKVLSEFTGHLVTAFNQNMKESWSVGAGLAATMAVLFLTYSLGFWYGGKLVADDMDKHGVEVCFEESTPCFTGGAALAVFFCVVMAAFSVGQAGPNVSSIGRASTATQDLEALINRESKINPELETGVKNTTPLSGEIQFRDVSFAYPTRSQRPIFKNLNLTIPAGKSVALVGSSGCGKSTIVQMIQRFYDPDSGSITVDGVDIRDYNLRWLRRQMALVSQEPRLFAATLHDNIEAGKEGASEEEVVAAAVNANAHNFVAQFPQQYNTYAGEGGGQLSGGQKQRIAIARAIVRDPSILLLDEATSALDNESERIVQATLDKVVEQKKRTTLIIAHRLTTIRKADVIIVLDNPTGDGAEVREQGTHEELLRIPGGLYANLVASQRGNDEGREEQVTQLAEAFEDELPQRQKSIIKLRSKFSKLSRASRGEEEDEKQSKGCGKSDPNRVKWRTVAKLLKPYWPQVTLGLFGATLNGLVFPLFAICFARFATAFFLPSSQEVRDEANFWALIFIAFAGGVAIGNLLQQVSFGWAGHKVVKILREQTFESILHQDMEFFDDPLNTTGSLSEILSADVIAVRGWVGDNSGIYLQNIVALVAALIISFTASAKLAAVCLAACMALAPAMFVESKLLGSGELKATNTEKDVENAGFLINETIVNIRTIAAFSLEDRMANRYNAVVDKAFAKGMRKALIGGAAWGFTQFAQYGVQSLCLWYGGQLVARGEITGDEMMQAIFALIMAAMGFGQTMIFVVDGKTAQTAANKIFGIIQRKPKIDSRSLDGKIMSELENEVKFDHVNFRYPQRPDVPIYSDLSFSIRNGEVVALVGPSGCGKSTVVQLIERFYDVSDDVPIVFGQGGASVPSSGKITIDGSDIRDINVRSLRARIGLVNQEPVLFSSSIAENIALGKIGGATINEVEDAARKANAFNFIQTFPEGFQTNVGKLGGQLSGGQKQRIAIARAIIRNPSILILDEATSALDAESERVVQEALDSLLAAQKRSTVVIAHRLTTVRNADKIVVLVNENKQGSKVVEVGNHTELMKITGGVYRGLVEIAEGVTPTSPSQY